MISGSIGKQSPVPADLLDNFFSFYRITLNLAVASAVKFMDQTYIFDMRDLSLERALAIHQSGMSVVLLAAEETSKD